MKEWKQLVSLNLVLILLWGMLHPIAVYAAEGSGEERFRAVAWATGEACIDPAGLEYSVPRGSVLFSNGMILRCGMTPEDLGLEYDVTYDPDTGTVTDWTQTETSYWAEAPVYEVDWDIDYTDTSGNIGEYIWTVGDDGFRLDEQARSLLTIQGQSCTLSQNATGKGLVSELQNQLNSIAAHRLRMIDKDGDGDVDYVVLTQVNYAMITKAAESKVYGPYVTAVDPAGNALKYHGNTKLFLDDTVITDDPLNKGDIVRYSWDFAEEKYRFEVLPQLEAVVYEKRTTKGQHTFDGAAYEVADNGWTAKNSSVLVSTNLKKQFTIVADGDLLVMARRDIYTDIADINSQLVMVTDVYEDIYDTSSGQMERIYVDYITIDGEMHKDSLLNTNARGAVTCTELKEHLSEHKRLFVLEENGSEISLIKLTEETAQEILGYSDSLANGYMEQVGRLDTEENTFGSDYINQNEKFFVSYRNANGVEKYAVMTLDDLNEGISANTFIQGLYIVKRTYRTYQAGYIYLGELLSNQSAGYLYTTSGDYYTTSDEYYWTGTDEDIVYLADVIFSDGTMAETDLAINLAKSDEIQANFLYSYTYDKVQGEKVYRLRRVLSSSGTSSHYLNHDREILDYWKGTVYTDKNGQGKSFALQDEVVAVSTFRFSAAQERPEGYQISTQGIAFYSSSSIDFEMIGNEVGDSEYTQYSDYVYTAGDLFYVIVYRVENSVLELPNFDPAALYTIVFGELPPAGVSGNISWALDNGVLTLSGTGRMNDYAAGGAPWADLRDSIQSVRVAEGITTVGANAFAGCTALTEVQLPESVTYIGAGAFSGCTALAGIELPETVVTLDDQAFSGCTALCEITLPAGLLGLGEAAFSGCRALTDISIPGNVEEIGRSAFSNCSQLSRVDIGDGVESIGAYAFSGCTALNRVTVPDSVTEIGAWAFYRCTGLVSVELSENLEVLADNIFSGCTELTAVTLPDGLREIGISAFRGCEELAELTFPEGVRKIGASAFYGCVRLGAAQLPEALQSLGKWAFRGCSRLTEVRAGRALTDIGDDVFLSAGAELMVYGYSGSGISSYAQRYGINYTVIQIPRYTLRVYSNMAGMLEAEDYQGHQGAVIPMGEVADKLQREYFLYASDADLVGWNTLAGGDGASYDRDVSWTLEENAVLFAQWKTAEYQVDGQRYLVTEARQGAGWSYAPENRTLTLTNYQGGDIQFPGNANVTVTGRCAAAGSISAKDFLDLTIEDGAVLQARQLAADELTVRCEETGAVTVASGTEAPAVSAEGAHFYGKGAVRMESGGENALFCTVVTAAAECRLTASAQKYAVPGRFYFTTGSRIYLSAAGTEPERYAPGPYLRVEPWIGKVTLNANGGTWAGGPGSSRSFSLYYGEAVDLGKESQSLTRYGYRLMGWQDAEDRTEYSLMQTVSAENLTLFADWVKRELRVDGASYSINRDSSGTGWTYRHPTDAQSAGRVEIRAGYSGKPIYSSENLEIIFTGDHTITGRTGEPAVWSLGDLTLQQKTGSLTLRGGDGESAARAAGALSVENTGELAIQGGSGGIGLLAGTGLTVNNDGAMTVTGGVNGNAAAGRSAAFSGSGKTILVGAGACAASSADLVLDASLKYYTGSNAGNAVRGGDLGQAQYVRLQPRSILVTLYANGGTVLQQEVYTKEYSLVDSSEVTLEAAQGALGAVFTGWNTRLDGSGQDYPAGVPLTVDDSAEELRLFAQYQYRDQAQAGNGTLRVSWAEAIPEQAQIFLAAYDAGGRLIFCTPGQAENAHTVSFAAANTVSGGSFRVFFLDARWRPAAETRTVPIQ